MNVLILEDTMTWQELLCHVCFRNGWQPISVQSAEEAIQKLQIEQIDAAILDLLLPDSLDTETSLEVVRLFAKRLPGKVCVVSGIDNLPSKIGGCPVVSKMFADIDTLSAAIRAAFELAG